jgi:2-polyprenyl-6-hydroxyphenyl methylase/3-demethylubiquinone-9 3-methyltransferase
MTAITEKRADAVAYHGDLAEQWERRYLKKSFSIRKDVLSECLDPKNLTGSSWLDAGCGSGTLARLLAERGCRVLGIDASSEMVEVARKIPDSNGFHGQVAFELVDNLDRLQFSDNSFDGVLCSSVLEYLADPDRCLAEFARVLRPSGVLIVSVPNRQSFTRRLQLICHSLGKALGKNWFGYLDLSRNWYSVEEFTRKLELCGLETEKAVIFGGPFSRKVQQLRHWGSLMMFTARRK